MTKFKILLNDFKTKIKQFTNVLNFVSGIKKCKARKMFRNEPRIKEFGDLSTQPSELQLTVSLKFKRRNFKQVEYL